MADACKLYVTYRSEYLVLRDLCVGVRDRETGRFWPMHAAACSHVLGPLRANETPMPATPLRVGERLCLYATARRVITGPIVAIEGAPKRLLCEADQAWQALFNPSSPHDSMIRLEGGGPG